MKLVFLLRLVAAIVILAAAAFACLAGLGAFAALDGATAGYSIYR